MQKEIDAEGGGTEGADSDELSDISSKKMSAQKNWSKLKINTNRFTTLAFEIEGKGFCKRKMK